VKKKTKQYGGIMDGKRDYSDIILRKMNEVVLVLGRDGKVLWYTENVKKFFGLDGYKIEYIGDIGRIIPEDIWKGKCECVEILFEGRKRGHFLLDSIPFREGYILLFREEKPNLFFQGEMGLFDIKELKGIDEETRMDALLCASDRNPVLITGETGTGKEVLARAIHNASGYKGNFIPVNCGSIPHTLAESELFGYEPGSFTGADKGGRIGKIELSNKGTLFLDEIGDMPMEQQVKLLGVLERKEVWRIGGKKPIKVDFKLISATNRNIEELIKKDLFRNDLYQRIKFHEIHLKPLRERKEFIEELIEYFLNKHNGELRFSDEAKALLKSYHWPGNIRELEYVIEKMIMKKGKDKDNIVSIEDLKGEIRLEEKKEVEEITIEEKAKVYKAKLIYERYLNNNKDLKKTSEELNLSERQIYRYLRMIKEN